MAHIACRKDCSGTGRQAGCLCTHAAVWSLIQVGMYHDVRIWEPTHNLHKSPAVTISLLILASLLVLIPDKYNPSPTRCTIQCLTSGVGLWPREISIMMYMRCSWLRFATKWYSRYDGNTITLIGIKEQLMPLLQLILWLRSAYGNYYRKVEVCY